MNAKNIVTVGGGTGTFVVLSALKRLPHVTLKAIVSVADDGGATGRLRDAYGSLPMGDARQALIALSGDNGTSLMRTLFAHRFSKGDIAGHNFGNLLLTALTEILGNEAEAIQAASKILRVQGYVVPVSDKPTTLVAELQNGERIVGEHEIDAHAGGRSPIVSLTTKESARISAKAEEAIREADIIILGPGDLYTSTLANLVVPGMKEAVSSSSARLVYIVNLFTRAGQTEGYSAMRHVDEIERYAGRRPDIVLMHVGDFPAEALKRYEKEKEFPVKDDLPNTPSVIRGQFADATIVPTVAGDKLPRSFIRHSSEKIAEAIEKLL
jgi:uncharacterized cofD-like protein